MYVCMDPVLFVSTFYHFHIPKTARYYIESKHYSGYFPEKNIQFNTHFIYQILPFPETSFDNTATCGHVIKNGGLRLEGMDRY